jgi:replicative DNA helicase
MSIGTTLIAALVDSSDGLSHVIRLGLGPELFKGNDESLCWTLVHGFVVKYGSLPSRALFESQNIELPVSHPEPIDWYADQVRNRHTHLTLKQTLLDVQEYLNNDKPQQGLHTLEAAVLALTKTQQKSKLVDFAKEGAEIIAQALKQKKLDTGLEGIKFGWPTLDAMADGLMGGDLVSIIGRPGAGKTIAMLYTASYAWNIQGKKVMFVSMEMKPLLISQRLAALNTKKPITSLKKGELSTAAEKDLMSKLESYKEKNQFWVVDGALTATMREIILLARMLKPDVVWIDGAYLVRGEKSYQQRWDRITDVVEKAKGDLAEALNIPVVISFQFNRQQKKGQKGTLDNIAYADAVGQLSSVILGLGLADDEDSVESLYKRQVEVLKGRNGEIGSFNIRWQFDSPAPDFMNFSEVKSVSQEDLVFGVD